MFENNTETMTTTDKEHASLLDNQSRVIVWIDQFLPPDALVNASMEFGGIKQISVTSLLDRLPEHIDVAVMSDRTEEHQHAINILKAKGIPSIVISNRHQYFEDEQDLSVIRVSPDTSTVKFTGILHACLSISKTLQQTINKLVFAKREAELATRFADSMDEELHLAASLQRDFLPNPMPKLGEVRFMAYYRPAEWVSGDIYDVFRLDETHIGFYIADAVGHGIPAALLTMFIKSTIRTKRISGSSYEIIPPNEVMSNLNDALLNQQLSMCEFCTACYGILNIKTKEIRLSRAGHPKPLLIDQDGNMKLIDIPGPLLGIVEEASYRTVTIQASPGDRFMLYSDGLEDSICGKQNSDANIFLDHMAKLANLSRKQIIHTVDQWLPDNGAEDDVTMLILELLKE